MQIEALNELPFWLPLLFSLLLIWEGVWKGIGLWNAARNKQTTWFIAIFIFNTLGLLPIIYLKFFQRRIMPLR